MVESGCGGGNGEGDGAMNSNATSNSPDNDTAGMLLRRRPRANSTGGDRVDNGGGDGRTGCSSAGGGGGGGGGGGFGAAGFLRERLRTGTVDYDHGDAMDDELRKILVPDELDEHEYDDDDHEYDEYDDEEGAFDDDVEANVPHTPGPFDRYNPADMSSGGGELDDDEIMDVIDGPDSAAAACRSTTPRTLPSTSTLGKYSTTAVLDDAIGTCCDCVSMPFALL
jgi:hypothetical protein